VEIRRCSFGDLDSAWDLKHGSFNVSCWKSFLEIKWSVNKSAHWPWRWTVLYCGEHGQPDITHSLWQVVSASWGGVGGSCG
jgi:hypothetical protein